MAEQTVDQMLDGGAGCLQYFKEMLDLAKRISSKQWPDWRDHVCRNYDNERGIDLASLRGDAVMLRQQATAATQAVTDQAAARTSVQTAWPDNAGRQAVTTLNAHQTRSEPVATILERTATAAEAVPDAVVAAVATKISDLSEFDKASFGLGDVGFWDGAKIAGGLMASVALGPLGALVSVDGASAAVERFEAQLAKDLTRFDQVVATAVSAVQAAYATVPAAAKGIDSSAFPAPSFGTITATSTETPTSPTTASPVTSGGGGGGGSPTTSSPSSTSPTSTSPTSTSPTTTGTTTSPTSTSPTTTGTTTSPTTTGASTTPSTATPSTGTGTGTGSGTPSWLSQLLPKIAEQLGLGDKSTGDGKDTDKTGDKGADKAGDKDTKSEKVLGVDALGRTVTATLSPDGKTVEVTAKKPDGTVAEKATLTIGEDGKLTPVDGTTGDGKDGTGAGGKGEDGTGKTGDAKPGETKPTQNDAGTGGGATPATASPSGAGGGTGGGATPSAAPSPVVPNVPTAPAAPAKPSNTGDQNPAPAEEPCPPGESADQGTGAEFAVSGS
ncbi:hypothetical protein LB823_21070 [Tsukamurella sp. M9C]|uniref:hypothetical protein n=1 Tax=unclassified Tsukamurella TaxID=2633480 RepID=UPI001CCDE5DC|nr:hypothetical protein [Tsukamurella sp. M9C]MCA0158696.1 hypothetical protein [Tsukamurella sp. M9C]